MRRLSVVFIVSHIKHHLAKQAVRQFEFLLLLAFAAIQLGFSNRKLYQGQDESFPAQVATDQFDYPPGSTVRIFGKGFTPGEAVVLQVSHVDTSVTGGQGHLPWTVTASASGGFAGYWAVPFDDNLGEELKVTAVGGVSRKTGTAYFVDANTLLLFTTRLPDTLCPGETLRVCANLSQRCGNGNVAPLPGRPLIFFVSLGDCGVNVGQNGRDTVLTDALGDACLTIRVPATPGEFSIRVKFRGEDRPDPCPAVGNSACNPTDSVATKRCTRLSSANACLVRIADSSACGCRAPILSAPGGLVKRNDLGQCGAFVNFAIQAQSKCGPVTVTCTPAPGSFFLVGTTEVSCTGADNSGNSSTVTFPVTVQDSEPPQILCPANITVSSSPGEATSPPVNYSASAIDNCAAGPVTCVPPSGSTFPIGVTAVTCMASDASHNSATGSFTVTVNSILLYHETGKTAGDQLGFAVAGGGDVNGDGVTDFLVTVPGADGTAAGNATALPDAGAVDVYSGADGSLLYQLNGSAGGDRLGGSVGFSGDVDGDGSNDIIVGAPYAAVNGIDSVGEAFVYSGKDGHLLYEIKGGVFGDRMGGSVGIIGDVNGDGYADFVVGAPGYSVGGSGSASALPDAGAVFVYSGKDGSLLYQLNGSASGDRLGGSIGVSGDVNLDGEPDFIVGAPDATINGMEEAGAAYVYSGPSGQLIFQATGTSAGDRLGGSVGISGDVDGDGADDIIVGAPYKSFGTVGNAAALLEAGAAYVYSGSGGNLLYQINGTSSGDRLGGSVGISGDLDSDGKDEFLVSAPNAAPNGLVGAGSVTIYSGSNGSPLFHADGLATGDHLGASVVTFKSTSSGGVRFLLGAPDADAGGMTDVGAAFVYQIAYKGDLDGDGRLGAADVVLLLNCIFMNRGFCPPALADMNCDGSIVSPTDVVVLLNAAFLGLPVTCVQ